MVRPRLLYSVILGLAAVFYIALNSEYHTGTFNDDAAYVIAAENMWNPRTSPLQSLVQSRPDFPFPGLPLLLAPFVKLVQPQWILVEWVSVLVALISVVLFSLFLKSWFTLGESLPLLAIYAFNPTVGKYSGVLLPTLYFIAAVLASFLLVEKLLKKPAWPTALGLGLMLAWGSLMRPEGFLLLLTVPVAFIYDRRWKDLLRVMIIPALAWIVFVMKWMKALQSLHTEYGGDLSALLSYWPHHLGSLILFAGTILQVVFIRMLSGITLPKSHVGMAVATAASLIGLGIVMAGFYSCWKSEPSRRGPLLGMGLFCAAYLFAHTLWHVAISRYCVVVLPFVLLFLYKGLRDYFYGPLQRKLWIGACSALLILAYGYRDGTALRLSLWAPNPMNSPPWKSLDWLAHNTPAASQVLSVIAPNVILYSQRAAISMISANNEEDFLYLLLTMHLDYIADRPVRPITTDVPMAEDPGKKWDQIRRWMQRHPEVYRLVFSDTSEKSAVYRVQPAPGFLEGYQKYMAAVQRLGQGHPDDSVALLQESLRLFPNLGSAHNALGVTYYLSRNHLKEAEGEFLKAAALLPDYPNTLLNLACLCHLEGRSAESLAYVQKALDISTANGEREQFVQRARLTQEQQEIDLPKKFPS